MGEKGSDRRPFGDLTNVLGKRPASSDLEKSAGGIKIVRVKKAVDLVEEFDEIAKANGGSTGNTFDHLSDGSSGFHNKEQESSLESEGGCEDEDDDMDSEFLAYTRDSRKTATNDGECLTQEEVDGSSGNQRPLSALDVTTGDDMPCSNVHHPSLGIGVLEEADTTKACPCSFCRKAAFMWTDLHYQDARGRLSALRKSIKFARSLGTRSQGNEHAVNPDRYNLKRTTEMEFELSQQQRSLFLHTENVLIRETAQLHSALVKLKDFRENCKTDLEMISSSLLEK
ncbi:hypothetical protein GUJ93_ZPchr0006g43959 [Zizania palustris]|uniref:Uncharacterized protein n=1 Tax=Zizania palustris TaxID=103762 RepID=A0A8J5W380_ZIZPA|nr:hypothetical protein GUJ93_ZPchr0006g43959 [Zizania palustris]